MGSMSIQWMTEAVKSVLSIDADREGFVEA